MAFDEKLAMEIWHPIEDLPSDWESLRQEDLLALANVWQDQKQRLEDTKTYKAFLNRMRRKFAIETGVIEQLYTIDRGTTQLLIEQGIDVALIAHDATNRPASEVVALIRDSEHAIEGLFDFVASQRDLSNSYIKQLHQLLTRHQEYTDAVDQFGNPARVQLLRGDWKKHPNNPKRNGIIYMYCPPEQVASQMDQLIAWHLQHVQTGVSPDIEASWLHHRFTQIHPFQDGNGRVARLLASLVYIRAGWFPLVITRDDRSEYIEALEAADAGNLGKLVALFSRIQRQAFINALSLSEQVLAEGTTIDSMLDAVVEKLQAQQSSTSEPQRLVAEKNADALFKITAEKFSEVAEDVKFALARVIDTPVVYVTQTSPDGADDYYFRYQIIEIAKALDYFANLREYKRWVRMVIRMETDQTEFLISFHGLGQKYRGILVCSACAYHKVVEEQESSVIQDLQPLSLTPFEITYLEDIEQLQQRFRRWLENVIVVGLEYWRKSL